MSTTSPQIAKEMLDTMLGYLGFVVEIDVEETDAGLHLQVHTNESKPLIGRHGETLDDIQFLLERMLWTQDKDAPRVTVDVEHYREMQEDNFVRRALQTAEVVRKTGKPIQLEQMNSYQRHLVHEAFRHDPEVMSESSEDSRRFKRITLRLRETS